MFCSVYGQIKRGLDTTGFSQAKAVLIIADLRYRPAPAELIQENEMGPRATIG